MAYRAEIQIGVKGARSVEDLSKKIDRVASVIDRLNNERFSVAQKASKITAFQVAQEQKLISARQKYNDGLRESIALAIQFQDRIERAVRAAQTSRAESSRTLTGSKLAGLLPATPTKALLPAAGGTGAGAKAFERAAARAQKIDAFYKEVALFLKNIDQQIEQRRQAVKTVQSAVSRQPAAQPFGLLPPGRSVSSASAAPQRQEVSAAREVAAVRQVTGALTSNLQIQQKIKELKRTGVTLDQQLDDLTRQRLGASGEIVKQINSQIASTRQLRRENNTAIKDLSENLRNLPSGGFVQGSRSPISGNRDLNRNVRQSLRLEARLNNLKLEGLKTTKAESLLNELNNNLSKKDLNTTSAGLKTQKELIQDLRQELSLTKEIANSRSQGTKQQGGSRRGGGRLQNAVSSGLIGGAFPLLFGQGVGAAGGGLLGGALGGLVGGQFGFALSLVGTQLGAAVDGFSSLGQELNKIEPDVGKIVEKLGIAGTKTEQYINSLIEAGFQQEAAALAASELSRLIGNEGVNALKEFGSDTQELGNEFSRAMTVMGAALAQLINSLGFLKAIVNEIERVNLLKQAESSVDPQIQELIRRRETETRTGPGGTGTDIVLDEELSNRIVDRMRVVNHLKEQGIELDGVTRKISADQVAIENTKINAIKAKIKLAEANGDILDSNVFELKKIVLQREQEVELQRAINEGLSLELLNLKHKLDFLKLNNARETAQEREREKAAREGAKAAEKAQRAAQATRALSLELQLSQYITDQNVKINNARRESNSNLLLTLNREKLVNLFLAERAKINNEDISVIDKKLKISIAQEKSQQRLNDLSNQNLQRLDKIQAAVDMQLSSVQSQIDLSRARISGRLEEEKIEQAIAQIKENNKEISKNDLDLIRQKLELLNSQKSLEEAFNIQQKTKFAGAGLQAGFIGQAGKAFEGKRQEGASIEDATKIANLTQQMELAQVQAQALESAVLGIGNAFATAMTTGVSELIAGTKSAQEVFADFLKNIGDALVSAATQMIATYIAIGIAKAFAGMGSSGGGGVGKLPDNPLDSFRAAGVQGPIYDFQTRANGGPAKGGQPYMVGERGPELFVPGQSGGVMRNEDMRSLMGRSPASGGAASMNFSFETTSIGGTEYVSREQLESAMAVTRKQASNDGAKRGMNMTLDKMQNSPRTRTRIGLR